MREIAINIETKLQVGNILKYTVANKQPLGIVTKIVERFDNGTTKINAYWFDGIASEDLVIYRDNWESFKILRDRK